MGCTGRSPSASSAGPKLLTPDLQFLLYSWPHSFSGPREQQVPSIRIQDSLMALKSYSPSDGADYFL